MKTRIVVPSVLVAVCLFSLTACHHGGKLAPKDLPIKCNVNPDEVMGTHYTSQDFQIHNVLDEYSTEWTPGMEPYYPVNDARNMQLLAAYQELAQQEENIIFAGRLAEYKYYDMAPTIARAMELWEKEAERG